MKILISLVRPLKCRIPASVGIWNEEMTNRLTVVEGSQSYSRLYGEDFADQSSKEEGPPKNMKILISLVRHLKCRIPESVGI